MRIWGEGKSRGCDCSIPGLLLPKDFDSVLKYD